MSEWISVQERLPEIQGYLWVVGEGSPRIGFYDGKRFEDDVGDVLFPTHWQGLTIPDPPPRKWSKEEALKEAIKVIEETNKGPLFSINACHILPKLREALT